MSEQELAAISNPANDENEEKVSPTKRTPSKRKSHYERAQEESKELLKNMGVEDLSDGRQTRRSTRSSTKSQTPAPVTPPAAKKTPATPNSSRRGRKKKIQEEEEEIEENNVEQILESEEEQQPLKKRQKLSETIENIEKAVVEDNTDKLDGPSTTNDADNCKEAITAQENEKGKENGDSVEEKMEVDEQIVESSATTSEAAEEIVKESEAVTTSEAAEEIVKESNPVTIDDSSNDQPQPVESSVVENKLPEVSEKSPSEAVPDSSEVISIEDEASVESLPTITTTAVIEEEEETPQAMLVESSSSSDDVQEVVAKPTVESTSSEAAAEQDKETPKSDVVQEKSQEIETMEVDSSSVVPAAADNNQVSEPAQSEPQESSLSESNEVQQEVPTTLQTGEIQVNDVQPTEEDTNDEQGTEKVNEAQAEELPVEIPSESILLPPSEVVEGEKIISSTDDIETKVEASQDEPKIATSQN